MKKLIVFALLFTLGVTAHAQTVNDFYHTHKKEEGVFNLTLPGWLMRMAINLSGTRKNLSKDERRLLRKIRRVRLLSAEETSAELKRSAGQLPRAAICDQYEEFALIQDQKERINLLIREDDKAVRKLLILIQEEDTLTMIDLKMKVKYELLEELLMHSSGDFFAHLGT